MQKLAPLAILASMFLLSIPASLRAIIPGRTDCPYVFAARVGNSTGGDFEWDGSGVAIAPHWVLTARHCVERFWSHTHVPAYPVKVIVQGAVHDSDLVYVCDYQDIALVHTDDVLPGYYGIYRNSDEVLANIDVVGFGNTGRLIPYAGTDDGPPPQPVWEELFGTNGVLRWGTNIYNGAVTGLGSAVPVNDQLFAIFDPPGTGATWAECTVAHADSGGPSFINGLVAGIHLSASAPAYGAGFQDARVSLSQLWIDSVLSAAISTVSHFPDWIQFIGPGDYLGGTYDDLLLNDARRLSFSSTPAPSTGVETTSLYPPVHVGLNTSLPLVLSLTTSVGNAAGVRRRIYYQVYDHSGSQPHWTNTLVLVDDRPASEADENTAITTQNPDFIGPDGQAYPRIVWDRTSGQGTFYPTINRLTWTRSESYIADPPPDEGGGLSSCIGCLTDFPT